MTAPKLHFSAPFLNPKAFKQLYHSPISSYCYASRCQLDWEQLKIMCLAQGHQPGMEWELTAHFKIQMPCMVMHGLFQKKQKNKSKNLNQPQFAGHNWVMSHSTYDFVLLPVPDGTAEQTLDLVAGMVWILTLSEKHCGDITVRIRQWT